MNRRTSTGFVFGFSLFVAIGLAKLPGQEITFVEDFALTDDRATELGKLVPGTEQYYYFHCLHFQNTEQFEKVDSMLSLWIERFGESSLVKQIQNRQALLTYSSHPQATLDYLQRHLSLRFDHQRQLPSAEPGLPSNLEADLISYQRLFERAIKSHRNTDGFETIALHLIAQDAQLTQALTPQQRRHLLQRLSWPDISGLPELIRDDLLLKNSQGFGAYTIHRNLTLSQLDELLNLRPRLLNEQNFVNIYLSKLAPGNDTALRDDEAMIEYLDRLWQFAETLQGVHNSLKANILYRRLSLDRRRGVFDKSRFIEYLRLPRQVFYINREILEDLRSSDHLVNLNADYRSVTSLRPIVTDEPLVRDYLHHFLIDQPDYQEFLPWVDADYLRKQFATVKILNGIGESEKWASMLDPDDFQQLMSRVDLDFAPTNPRDFPVDQPVELELHVKNVKNLIVKIFEINTSNYYRTHGEEIDTDINLDGLVPNWQESYQYDSPPLMRISRQFRFDEIDRRGVYIIDFIGNGKSSRALIRKGQLRAIVETNIAGQRFTIVDENREIVRDASVWVAGREFAASEDGTVTIPFSTQPGAEFAVIQHAGFSSLVRFQHEGEQYELRAGIYVDRESLLRGSKATVLVQPQLWLSGAIVPLELLSDVRLFIATTDLDQVSATQEVRDLKLEGSGEIRHEFQVPPRLQQITFTLSAKVKNISLNSEQNLVANQTFTVNRIDSTNAVNDLHLMLTDSGYVIEARGKSGEPRTSQAVRLVFKHEMFTQPIDVSLQSDDNGHIQLGALDGIQSISATWNVGEQRKWTLNDERESHYGGRHATTEQTLTIPVSVDAAEARRSDFALLEIRRGTMVADHFEALELQDGLLKVKPLPAGDYRLWIKPSGRAVRIRVTDGKDMGRFALSPARTLELKDRDALHVKTVETDENSISVQLGGDLRQTRVHVFATRYVPGFDMFSLLGSIRDEEPLVINLGDRPSTYIAGRTIGEEYQYILNRQYAAKFPGVMLSRPSLLLNPWAIRTTENTVQAAAGGEDFSGAGGAVDGKAERESAQSQAADANQDPHNLDFLAADTVALFELKPDENGTITIDRGRLGDKHLIHIVVQDETQTLVRRVSLPQASLVFRDLRLSRGLDPDNHFAQKKQYDVIQRGETLQLDDLLSSKFQHYDDLGDIYRYYVTLTGDETLAKFEFVTRWPSLSPAEKREIYSRHACHELHFFLLHKDPEFFTEFIQPYLTNKLSKTFMDLWLIEDDVDRFVKPWEYQRLNAVERILLSQRISARRDQLQRHIEDAYELNPTSRQQFDQWYSYLVLGTALDVEGVAQNFYEIQDQSIRRVDSLSEMKRAAGVELSLADQAPGRAGNTAAATPQPPALARGGGAEATLAEPLDAAESAPAEKAARAERNKGMTDGDIKADWNEGANSKKLADRDLGFAPQQDLGRDARIRDNLRQYYQRLKPTQEWVENNYYHLPIEQQSADLVDVNRFWQDYARHSSDARFLSPYFTEASGNFTEMMLALSVLDLPFESPEHDFEFVDNQMRLTPAGDVIAFYQEIRPAIFDRSGSSVLVSENFFRNDDRYRIVNGRQYDKFVTDEFLTHVLYGGQVVVTNPTSTPQEIDLLIQVPAGSMAAAGSQETRTIQMDLAAFSSSTIEYYFYFPVAGDFKHFPAHVSVDDLVTAVADPLLFRVVDEPSEVDKDSWTYISQNGSPEQVLEFLRTENLQNLDLSMIAFRMTDADFFARVIEVLDDRFAYDHTLWSYAILHNRTAIISEFLKHAESFLAQCGKSLKCELLSLDPVERRWYEHREFWPLVNARTHRLGSRQTILNDRIWTQYHELMEILSQQPTIGNDDHLAVSYYLFLQDRVDEALEHFDRVDRNQLATQLQYDYCASYAALYREQIDSAQQIAKRYEQYPVDRWREMFAAVLETIAEVRGQTASIETELDRQSKLASQTPSFDFTVEDRQTRVRYQNLSEVRINYYEMDIELLFSRNPFVKQQDGSFAMIRPNESVTVQLPADASEHSIELPEALKNSNVLVEITGAGDTKSAAYYAHSLNPQIVEQYGQLQVTHAETRSALPEVYVKVYARKADGSVHFYKDGYTDLRGRFDYASLSNQTLDDVQQFSMLILSPDHGAIVRQAAVPKE